MRSLAGKTLRPLLLCVVAALAGGQGGASGAGAAPGGSSSSGVRSAEARRQPDGTVLVVSPSYQAVIGSDGNLHSFRVGDAELIDDRIDISLGAFLFTDGPRRLQTVTVVDPRVVEATDGVYSIQYVFSRRDVRISIHNEAPRPVPYLMVVSPEARIVSNPETGEAAAVPANELWGHVRFITQSGAYLEVSGGSRIWGPWLGRQVWEVGRIGPGEVARIRLLPGVGEPPAPTLEQLVGVSVNAAAPDALVGEGEPIELQVTVDNRSDRDISGLVSMEVAATRAEQVMYFSADVAAPAKQISATTFRARVNAADFYRARASISVLGKEIATGKAGAGYRVEDIIPSIRRRADFAFFWEQLVTEAHQPAPELSVTAAPSRSPPGVATQLARYTGVGGKTIHGWYLRPTAGGRHPGVLYLSGYGARPITPPAGLATQGYVVLAIDVRGNPVGRPRPRAFEDYSLIGIESPETYVYREIVGHCLRAIQALRGQAEVDEGRIAIVGVSEGGGLALILAALCPEVKAVVAASPMLCDLPLSLRAAGWPYTQIAQHIERRPDQASQVLRTLSYFDAVNFASEVKCPVLLSVGFLDQVSLPSGVYGAYNLLGGSKEIRALPKAGHEGGGEDFWAYSLSWLAKALDVERTQ